MNILMAFLYSPPTTACYYAKAFRALGHDVRTWGPSRDLSGYREDQRYRLTGPHMAAPLADGWRPDLYVYIEAGAGWFPNDVPQHTIPSVAYFIDSHSRLQEHLERAPYFDHVFYAHKQFGDAFGPGTHWLPVACDPEVHTPTVMPDELEYDVAFVGNVYPEVALYEPRREALRMLAGRYKCQFVSGVYFEDMANVYANARVVFNRSAHGDLNMRVFEAMCSGRPLMTDYTHENGILDMFEPYVHLMYYEDLDDLTFTAAALINGPRMARMIGAAGRAAVLAEHTYIHRAQQMLADVGI